MNVLSWRWWFGLEEKPVLAEPPHATVAAIVPAYNEEASIARTIRSLQAQTYPLTEIIVVDDCSSDKTADIARSTGVTVIRTAKNQGTKAMSQNYVLPQITADYFVTIDGDTILAPDAVYEAMRYYNDPKTEVVCGMVVPQKVSTFWEYGRLIEYLFGQSLIKPAQAHNGLVLVASGCFSIYPTRLALSYGGFNKRTLAEDMDLTWDMQENGGRVYFAPKARCYPVDPPTWPIYFNQLDRWYRGFFQNLKVRKFKLFPGKKGMAILVYFYLVWFSISAFIVPIATALLFFGTQDLLLTLQWLLILNGLFVWIPSSIAGIRAGVPIHTLLLGFLVYLTIPYFNMYIYVQAFWKELVKGETLTEWKKGH